MRYGASKNFKSLFLYIERDHCIGDSNQLTIPRPENALLIIIALGEVLII